MFKKSLALVLITSSCSALADAFTDYVHQYQEPELFEQNLTALDARLKLLDMAPAGGTSLISTFVFDNGRSVRQLARHICKAQERGVHVELIADGKSGDVVGRESAFDASDDAKVTEELYQYMANCGAKVYVHNPVPNYIEISGQRLPNVFLDPAYNGKTFSGLFGRTSLLVVKRRLDAIVSHAADLIDAELRAAGMQADSHALLNNLKSFALDFLEVQGALKNIKDPAQEEDWIRARFANSMAPRYLSMVRDPIWDTLRADQLERALPGIIKRFKADPLFAQLGKEIRRFNRLNHRKMFLVQSQDGKDGCLILGGRNLGDHYLQNTSLAFLDGDVLICRHQSPEASRAIDAAVASFKDLKTNTSDFMMKSDKDNSILAISKNPSYTYSYLTFPRDLLPKGARVGAYKGKDGLPPVYRMLIGEKNWDDSKAVHGDQPLQNTSGWRLLTAGWNPEQDEISQALLQDIQNENKQIYIETAYGEFNGKLRAQLEQAMERGVKVSLITNSMFISDGASRLIRLLMDNWMIRTKAKYGDLFDVQYTTADARHMTHFKGAAFACQGNGDKAHRSYIVGSHNFHPRSGRTDKEHALTWNEPAGDGCSRGFNGYADLVHARHWLYKAAAEDAGRDTLAYYPNLDWELASIALYSSKTDAPSKVMGNELRQIFYLIHADGGELKEKQRVQHILQFVDASGLHDLLGLLF